MYTKIHKKYYDLSGFDHPGGMIAISLAASRDATELYELHHQFSDKIKVSSILKKYEIPESACPEKILDSDVYDWEKTLSSEFTQELKQIARKELGRDIKANNQRWLQYTTLALLLLSQFYAFKVGYWLSIFTFPLSLWIFSVNVFHDATHFAISENWVVNKLGMNAGFMLATPYHWLHQHTIGHHSFPNVIGKDPDLYHAPEALRHSHDVPITNAHRIQHIVFMFIQVLGIPGEYLFGGGIMCMLGFPYNQVVSLSRTKFLNGWGVPFRLLLYLGIMHFLAIVFHGTTIRGIVFMLVPEFVYTACFTICSQVNHLVPEATGKSDSNFFIHQIITANNVNTSGYWTTLFTGGLNLQIEHHLFPSVNHCHLPKLVPHVKALCLKHDIHYPECKSLVAAFIEHVKHLYNMGPVAYKKKYSMKSKQM